ncbi:MAG: hypothetical protein AB1705_07460 [Verrucomicrobiota bacterium]
MLVFASLRAWAEDSAKVVEISRVVVPAEVVAELKATAVMAPELSARSEKDPEFLARFEAQVRKLAPHFPLVPVTDRFGTNTFFKVRLNEHGGGFDGIRFISPATSERDLVWLFGFATNTLPRNLYIVALDGPIRGFRFVPNSERSPGVREDYSEQAPWGKWAEKYVAVIQDLPGGEIKPAREYVLWFAFGPGGSNADLCAAINLVPPKPASRLLNEIEAALGFLWD